jgi:hypothetical protein
MALTHALFPGRRQLSQGFRRWGLTEGEYAFGGDPNATCGTVGDKWRLGWRVGLYGVCGAILRAWAVAVAVETLGVNG